MNAGLYLGIDLGTSGVRCAVVDDAGHECAHAQIRYPTPTGPLVDAEDWWRATEACLDQQMQALRAKSLSPGDIRGLAIDGTSGSMVLVDEAIQPVTPGLMYHSAGFEAEAAVISQHAEPGSITRGSNSALARMLRLQSHDADFTKGSQVFFKGWTFTIELFIGRFVTLVVHDGIQFGCGSSSFHP